MQARLALSALTVYRGLWKNAVFGRYARALEAARGVDARAFFDAYGGLYAALSAGRGGAGGAPSLPAYVAELLECDDNPFTRAAAAGEVPAPLRAAAESDLSLLSGALLSAAEVKAAAAESFGAEEPFILTVLEGLPEWEGGPLPYDEAVAAAFYAARGCGAFARYGALRWRGGALHGVPSPDPVRFADLKGYGYERGVVADNTLRFLEGNAANNILLYGDRGTGKSSTVKAVANEYREKGLRIIEVPKKAIAEFPAIAAQIEEVPLHFILFIDDLSFERDDDSYAALKGVLEGGLATRPRNTVIYATSNRRHFVRERFSERAGDDVHAADAIQETLSLADRFGITVTFSAPDQARYLEIVRGLAADRGLSAPGPQTAGGEDALTRGALQWALLYNGRSPRTARQYVDWAEARLKKNLSLIP